MKERFDVTGMTCSACSSHVEKSVGKLTGVENVSVNLLTNSMQVEFDENKLDIPEGSYPGDIMVRDGSGEPCFH